MNQEEAAFHRSSLNVTGDSNKVVKQHPDGINNSASLNIEGNFNEVNIVSQPLPSFDSWKREILILNILV